MRSNLDQLYRLACGRNLADPRLVFVEQELRHTYGALISEDQPFHRARAIAGYGRHAFLGDRKDTASLLIRLPIIEHAKLDTWSVFLNDCVNRCAQKITIRLFG